jgi:O-antigen ligase
VSNILTNPNPALRSAPRGRKLDLRIVGGFSLAVIVGIVATILPWVALGCLGAILVLGFGWLVLVYLRRASLELWQMFLVVAVSGYILLNYGFENMALHVGGIPIIVSYGLMYGAMGLAVLTHRNLIPIGMKEPAIDCMLGLIALAALHLVLDLPAFGMMAIRDATMFLDGMFMFLGLCWALKKNSLVFFTRWLLVLFVLNMFYGLTQPWQERIWGWSPESGVFQKVAVIGNFNGIGDVLLTGALFCICVGGLVIKRPAWLMQALVVGQFIGFVFAQVRRMYVASAVVLLILIILGEGKKFAKLLILLPATLLTFVLVTSALGIEISGRIGPVNLDFFKDHIRSIHTSEGTPGSAVESRYNMADEALQHFYDHPLAGVGFGEPLLTDIDMTNGTVTRMPHDSSLSVLARLGLAGIVVWIAFHFCLIKAFVSALRQRKSVDPLAAAFVLWAFLFYVLFMIGSFVEAPFEFPSGAVPFYFFMGFSLGVIRTHFSGKSREATPSEQRPAALATV